MDVRGLRGVQARRTERRGRVSQAPRWKETTGAKAYIKALRNSTASIYEVSDIVVGESFLARDLVRCGEPVRVQERTRSLRQWDLIAARTVTVLGKTALTGGLLPFSRPLADDALARIERARKKACAEVEPLAKSRARATPMRRPKRTSSLR
jgi:hypothetical protein